MSDTGHDASRRAESGGRRGFFRALAGVSAAAVGGVAGVQILQSSRAEAAEIPPPLAEPAGNILVRMQRELEQAVSGGKTPSWRMVVDTRKCIGCDACTVACKAENPTGPGANFRKVIQLDLPTGPRPWAIYKPVNCLQCDDAPCMRAVPQGMIVKRADGIVEFDQAKLRGPYAEAAVKACPLNQAHVETGRTYTESTPNPQEYEARSFVENGAAYSRKPGANRLVGAARKCTFCSHQIYSGVLPACVSTCMGGAMYFGDANNPQGLIQELTKGRTVFKGHEDRGLKPRVIYFTESMPDTPHLDCVACHS